MPRANIAWEARLASMKLLRDAYAAFNARDIDAALGTMHPDVVWPNGMEGGYVHGHDAVRAYWTRQWDVIDPHVEPRRVTTVEPGRVVVGSARLRHRGWRDQAHGDPDAYPPNVQRGSAAGISTSGSFSSRRTRLAPRLIATHL